MYIVMYVFVYDGRCIFSGECCHRCTYMYIIRVVAKNQWQCSVAFCHNFQLRKHVCLILVDFFMPCMSTDCGVLVIYIFVS